MLGFTLGSTSSWIFDNGGAIFCTFYTVSGYAPPSVIYANVNTNSVMNYTLSYPRSSFQVTSLGEMVFIISGKSTKQYNNDRSD
jgi:hypothetical protein